MSAKDEEEKDKADSLGSPRGSLSADSDEEIKESDVAKTTDVKFGKVSTTVKELTSKVTAADEDVKMEYSVDKSTHQSFN